ncbi:hypothetical protein LTR53_019179, partial [Teratosphaeriaceae sp. CCFEE 6253]
MATLLPTPDALDQMAVVDPEIEELLKQVPQLLQIPEGLEPEALVMMMRAGFASMPVPPPDPAVEESKSTYTTRDGTNLRLYVFKPAAQASAPRPLFVWYHGGGGCLGSPESTSAFCREVALTHGAVVIAPQYRLAPEHKSPAQ